MKLSCLCASHDRQAFMPWLAWVFNQIDWDGDKELVLVDSTPGLGPVHPITGLVPEEQLVYIPSDEKSIASKYQRALESASGDVVFWMDDDDYHLPDAATRCLPHLKPGVQFVYPRVNLFWVRMNDWAVRRMSCFWWSAGLYRRESVLACPPFEGKSMCTEIRWATRIQKRIKYVAPELGTVGFCLAHTLNISNNQRRTSYRHRYAHEVGWPTTLGLEPEHMADLLLQLDRLKIRLDGGKETT